MLASHYSVRGRAGRLLRFCARTRGNLRVPAREVFLIGLDADFRHAAEVNRDHRRDIRDREAVSSDKLAVGQFTIKPFEAVLGVEPLDVGVFGHLADTSLEEFMALAERIGDWLQQIELHSPVPHIHLSALFRADAEQVRFGMKLLEVAADRYALRDTGAVVEFEHWYARHRVFLAKFGLAVDRLPNIDIFVRHLDTLLGEENAHPARIGGGRAVVNFHCRSSCGMELNAYGRAARIVNIYRG